MITAAQVKELREKTGAGMMDCKKALTNTDGEIAILKSYLSLSYSASASDASSVSSAKDSP